MSSSLLSQRRTTLVSGAVSVLLLLASQRATCSNGLPLDTTVAEANESSLRQTIREIAADAHGKVSVACSLPGSSLNCDLNPHVHPPMQSVFKLPLALTILHQIEQGTLSLYIKRFAFFPATALCPMPTVRCKTSIRTLEWIFQYESSCVSPSH